MIAVTNVAQVKSGILNHFMPGARCLMIVTIKFSAVNIVPRPDTWTPNT